MRGEQLLEVNTDHRDICLMDERGPHRQDLIMFLEHCFAERDTDDSQSPRDDADLVRPTLNPGPTSHNRSTSPLPPMALLTERGSHPSLVVPEAGTNGVTQSSPEFPRSSKLRPEPKWPVVNVEPGMLVDDFAGKDQVLTEIDSKLASSSP